MNASSLSHRFTLALISLFAVASFAKADGIAPNELSSLNFEQHLDRTISAGLTFTDSDHRVVTLGRLYNDKPTLLVPGYYHCPMLCTLINDGLIESLQELRLNIGRDFRVINVSIDSKETPDVAAAKKREYLRRYGRDGAESGWLFLTGNDTSIIQLTNEVGYHFAYDSSTREYAHPSGFVVLTPQGKISRYFFGVNYDPKELREAILRAGKEESGPPIKQLILLCYHYNPITGRYGESVLVTLRALSLFTLGVLVVGIVYLVRHNSPTSHAETG